MKEEKREQKRREERRRILRSDMPLIAPAERVFFPNIFTFYSSKVIQGTVDLQSPVQLSQSRDSSNNNTPSSVPLPKLSLSPKNVFALSDYDSWRHSPQTLVGSLVYELQRSSPSKGQQKHGASSKEDKSKLGVRKRSD
ncbi:uncharacterized protein LOC121370682 [Gigantopelta aegis]|uniref:uncharacterized protein LOC121370682 n=1 Tax=Gigantopelta aegis TaxID=1735272 RepID=UPI001B88C6D3|nr:uncharacterized protein LOC121370682 [Gigantopelta aegis]